MSNFFSQLLLDGQADLALATVKLAAYEKATSANAYKKALRDAGLPTTEEDKFAVGNLLDEVIEEEKTWADLTRAEADAKKAEGWFLQVIQWGVGTNKYFMKWSASRAIWMAVEACETKVNDDAVAASGLTLKEIGALQALKAEAKKKITNAKNNLAGNGLAARKARVPEGVLRSV